MATTSQIMFAARQQVLDREKIAAAKTLEYYFGLRERIQGNLDSLTEKIGQMQAAGLTITEEKLRREGNRLNILLSQVESEIKKFQAISFATLDKDGKLAAEDGVKAAHLAINVRGSLGELGSASLKQIVQSFDSKPLTRKYGTKPKEVKDAVRTEIFQAIGLGKSPREITSSVMSILDSTKNDADVIARTWVISAHRDAGIEYYKQHQDRITEYQRICARNSRTCPVCLALDGKRYKLNVQFWNHPRCRCTTIPVLADEFIEDDLETAEEWFHKQDPNVKRAILGPTKLKLFNDNRITLNDLVDHYVDPDYGNSVREKSLRQLIRDGKVTGKEVADAFRESMGFGKTPTSSNGSNITEVERNVAEIVQSVGQAENREIKVAISKDGENIVYDYNQPHELEISIKNHLKDETFTKEEIAELADLPNLKKAHVILPNGDIHTFSDTSPENLRKVNEDVKRDCP